MNLADQEATVRTGHGTTDWFQISKGVCQGCILSPCLFTLYAEYIMRNTGLDEAQAGIKIARRNINNLRYADDTILMAESIEELHWQAGSLPLVSPGKPILCLPHANHFSKTIHKLMTCLLRNLYACQEATARTGHLSHSQLPVLFLLTV